MPAAGTSSAEGCVFVQNDNLKRFFCFLLCFILLISCIPRPAHALGVDWIVRQIATDIGVTGILEGLGVFRDSLNGNEYFNDLVSDIKHFLADSGLCALEYMDAYWRIDPLNSSPVLTIPLALIAAVRNYIFDNGIVSQSVSATSHSFTFDGSSYTATSSVPFEIALFWRTGSGYYDGVSIAAFAPTSASDSLMVQYNGSEYGSRVYGDYYVTELSYSRGTAYSDWHPATSLRVIHDSTGKTSTAAVYSSYFGKPVSSVWTDHPLTLGVISPTSTLFNAAYPQWLEHQRELEDGTTETVVQIGLGNTQAETESLTQEQVWSGQGSISVPGQDVTDATLTDILKSIIALPVQIVTSITTALTDFFAISGEASSFGIQLKDFFPFCIPFDLFDFLTVLSAEPQAPVFKWEIPVPQLGRTFEFEVDLSPWDSVASVFRTFELLAFIVGLALITREKFLRS